MRQQRSDEVKSSLDRNAQLTFYVLGCDFGQNVLLRKVLRGDRQRLLSSTPRQQKSENRQAGESRRSSHPSPPSEIKAINAAGTAPASNRVVSTVATPRKINTPRPPAPIAAAMVAVPIVVTVAMRMPARIALVASGSSTI